MVTSQNILYSASAIARIFNVAIGAVIKFEVWATGIWVYVKGMRPRLVSFRAFKQHFVDRRRSQAQSLQVFRSSMVGGYVVRNPHKDSQYIVTPTKQSIECACDDYQNQVQFFGRGCCKHGYAVLAQLGFTDLRSYVANQI
jgi:hypothetical protein